MIQIVALTAILSVSGTLEALHHTCLTNPANGDFWWHLRVGLGILQTHALPRTRLYSQAAALPWLASSWLFDIAVAAGYRMIGLRIVLLTAILFKFALALVVFVAANGFRGRFWTAIVLSVVAQYILGNLQPLPLCCSVIALCVELALVMECYQTGSARPLFWLPWLFLLWANLDVHFVYGVITLVWFAATCCIDAWRAQSGRSSALLIGTPSLRQVGIVTGVSLATTAMTPYAWHPYATFFSEATSTAIGSLPNYQSMRFRTPQDYILLLTVMAAFLALGRRRSLDPFQIGLLLLATVLGFRKQQDLWLTTVVAVAILANTGVERDSAQIRISIWRCATAAVAALPVVLVAVKSVGGSDYKSALAIVGRGFPVAAADYIREQRLPQPLFNTYQWGGFLTWYLPGYPVAADGRADLYGTDFNIAYTKMMNTDLHYSAFAPFNQAHTILLEKNSLMGRALSTASGFKVAYVDDVAVVLLRQEQQP
jgi:hypothetical protein